MGKHTSTTKASRRPKMGHEDHRTQLREQKNSLSGEVSREFQGQSQELGHQIVKRMLFVLPRTESYWKRPCRGVFHTLIGLVIGQRILWRIAQSKRSQLYSMCGIQDLNQTELTAQALRALSEDQWKSLKLGKRQMETIHLAIQIGDTLTLEQAFQLKGVGTWTKNGLQLLCGTDDRVFLTSDYRIQKNLRLLFGSVEAGITIIKERWTRSLSWLSLFLWRLTEEGAQKIRDDENPHLGPQDFLQ